jgi:uncharacterized damage-inducible protein DinB
MDLRHHFRLMCGWHVWTFEKLYACVEELSEDEYRKDAGLFFKSVHGTLNHMLLVELLWEGRLKGELFKAGSLADEIEKDRTRLRERLVAHAGIWRPMIDATPDSELSAELRYRSMAGDEYVLPRLSIIHTMFTHGAHHRGQVTTALNQMGKSSPELDFPYFLLSLPREERVGAIA